MVGSSGAPGTHLALHKHGHVHEHVVQLTDAVLQLDDLTVPRLNLTQGLLRDTGVHDDLRDGSSGLGPRHLEGTGVGTRTARGQMRTQLAWAEARAECSPLATALPPLFVQLLLAIT